MAVFFSVILPFYNASHSLANCIESVLHQSFTDFELLLVDDGSTDGSNEIALQYCNDARIHVFRQQNKGVSSARNLGLSKAEGRWITFIDSDDWVYPEWLSGFKEFISTYPYPEHSLIVENVEIAHTGQRNRRTLYSIESSERMDIDIWASLAPWGYPVNKCFLRSLLITNQILFDESLYVYEDELFVARYCSLVDDIQYINVIGYHYVESLDFTSKHINVEQFGRIASQYEKLRYANNVLADSTVNRLLVNTFLINSKNRYNSKYRVKTVMNILNTDISKVRGNKLAPLKVLSHTQSLLVWRFLFFIYSQFLIRFI